MNVFPFNVTGPEFLAVYAALCVTVAAGLAVAYRIRQRPDAEGQERLTDPYAIATLRGGPVEAVRIAMLSLTHRGHLAFADGRLVATGSATQVTLPMERAIVGYFRLPADDPPEKVCASGHVKPHALALRDDLVARRLLTNPLQPGTNPCSLPAAMALALLVGVAWLRIRWSGPPYGFLVTMCVMGSVAVLVSTLRRSTPYGRRVLRHLTTLFRRQSTRLGTIRPGERAQEIALLTAVFGVGVLAMTGLPWFDHFRAHAASGSSGCGSDTSSGSSSGDGGSGCGGGCGGGGD